MTGRIGKFKTRNRKLRAACALIISGNCNVVDDIIVGAARATWRATLNGLMIYGMAHFGGAVGPEAQQIFDLPRRSGKHPDMASACDHVDGVRNEEDKVERSNVEIMSVVMHQKHSVEFDQYN